ncbi:hypothetical protein [Thalassoroseus pseudoceratinae]|uniref:hypothetical protein n=1 Tax=Thalassoroseus pseudoceratinae TaxID=2713176 RepID=UPI001421EAD2|nr:hypothetical protein [Thalassoroseus pseudoceratinae]
MAVPAFGQRNQKPSSRRTITRLATASGVDADALHTLYSVFYDLDTKSYIPSRSWMDGETRLEDQIPQEQFDHAIREGVWVPSREMSAETVTEWFLEEKRRLPPAEKIGEAFMIGLRTSAMPLRSILGSYANFRAVNESNFDRWRNDPGFVGDVEDTETRVLAGLQFRRFFGPYMSCHEDIVYTALDFEQFNRLPTFDATDEDRDTMRGVLDAIRNLPATAQLTELNKCLTGTFPSNKLQRKHVVEILGLCDVLHPHSQPLIAERYIRPSECPLPSSSTKRDTRYPLCWWTAEDGVNEDAVVDYFPGLER